eukprot:CAMPEP_0172429096 /NCGR_PEP_ID=MMETSP1064-20121228/49025_1 /TAXON_ID=202472 /ORGANISM="Aulacoseira subarctica , Strain CCAP 1002/5" /LENGTH=235 /DNA_ID=CAMNT_0013174263 /DNA_START=133 /DNA_END=840 /DNA_ORIENTATION=+
MESEQNHIEKSVPTEGTTTDDETPATTILSTQETSQISETNNKSRATSTTPSVVSYVVVASVSLFSFIFILRGIMVVVPNKNGEVAPPLKRNTTEILQAHNYYRSQVGVPPLHWSGTLASHAHEYANFLSNNQLFNHSSMDREGEGESLWMGTASNSTTFTQMIESFGKEQQYYKHGIFPHVSTTGNWSQVGHYTQMIWRDTTQLGCAGSIGTDGNYRLVCRYWTAGNVVGQMVY